MMDLSIIIPCYNEEESIPKLRQEFWPVVTVLAQQHTIEIIFVDDGSRDHTSEALAAAFHDIDSPQISIKIERHPQNKGLGAAIRTGFKASSGEILITTDCDGTYKFTEIPALLAYLTPEIDIVTASPYHPHGAVDNVPGYRLVLSRGSSVMYRLLADRRVHTYTALFRAYRREVVDNITFEADGFLAGTELLVKAIRMGYQVAEYPTVLHSRVFGQSKAKIAQTVKAHLEFQLDTLLPWHPYGTIIRGQAETAYLIENGTKRPFPSAEIFLSHGYQWQQIIQVDDNFLKSFPDGPPMTFRNGTLLKESQDMIFVVEHGRKRPLLHGDTFYQLGYQLKDVKTVSDQILASLEDGSPLTSAEAHPDGTLVRGLKRKSVYLIDQGQKCLIPSIQVFRSWNYRWAQVIEIDQAKLAAYSDGPKVTAQPGFNLDDKHVKKNAEPATRSITDIFMTRIPYLPGKKN